MSVCISGSDRRHARDLIRLTQAGLPLVADPWDWLAQQMDLPAADVLALVQRLQEQGAIRRIAAVPNHYRLGYRHNGMTVWDIDDAHITRLGQQVGALPFVSHCYRRPRHPGWPYNLFAMVHGQDAETINTMRAQIRQLLGDALRSDDMLVSRRILKKTGLRIRSGEN
ncbi:MAG TPA: nitrite reductase [Burkholderiaceae bacterium]|nr:nitrite reductase [Burkholderiaceae bacterium]